jgi:hypothetical protein
MIQFSNGNIINTTFISNGTRVQLVNQLESALNAAGWSAISGAGTSDWIYETVQTPTGQKIRVEGIDPGSGNCAQFKLRSGNPNNLVAGAAFLLPVNGSSFRIWANMYQFFFYLMGVSSSSQRALVCGGVPYIWPFMSFTLSGSPWAGWMHANGFADTSTNQVLNTFRFNINNLSGAVQNYAAIWNEAIVAGAVSGHFGLIGQGGTGTGDFQYEDGSWSMWEPILCWPGGTADSSNMTRHGQLWDCAMIAKPYNSDDIRTIGGTTWMNITHQNGAVSSPSRGSILLVNT